MTDAQYFMRVRGQVQGPFGQEKLQRLSRRGQLSRLHEVSTDGVNWARASTFPELFVSPVIEPTVAPPLAVEAPPVASAAASVPVDSAQPETLQIAATPRAGSATPLVQWWYSVHGKEHGPVDFAVLQQMTAVGQLSGHDFLWKSGMAGWRPAAEVSGLVFADGRPGHGAEAADLPPAVCKTALALRPWALLLAIVICLSAGVFCIWGLWQFFCVAVHGASAGWTLLIGTLALLESGLLAAVAILLSVHASRLAGLRHSRQPVVLGKALGALRHVWIWATIALLLGLVLVALFLATLPAGEIAPAAGVQAENKTE